MGINYYNVLDVSPSSNELDISRAYQKLATQYNPERRTDQRSCEKFKLIGEAYDVLSNPPRRAVFDKYGEKGLKKGISTSKENISPYQYHGDPMKTYNNFFGTETTYPDLLDCLHDCFQRFEITDDKRVQNKLAGL